jgi:hypothetical protein
MTTSDNRASQCRVDASDTVFHGAVGWECGGVALDKKYTQTVYLTSLAKCTPTGHADQIRNPFQGMHLGVPGMTINTSADGIPLFAGIHDSSVRVAYNNDDGRVLVTTIPGESSCYPALTPAQAAAQRVAWPATHASINSLLGLIPGGGTLASAAEWGDVARLGFYEGGTVGAGTVSFPHFVMGASQPDQVVGNHVSLQIKTERPGPTFIVPEWRYHLFTSPHGKSYYSCAVKLQRGQLQKGPDGRLPHPEDQGAEYGFGLAGVERPLWTPEYA